MDNKQLVNNIKILCNNNNISISQLEKTLNLSPGLISRWIKTTPSLDRLIDIVNFFGVTLDELISKEIKSEPTSQFNNKKITYLIRVLYQETQYLNSRWNVLDIDNPPFRFNDLTSEIIANEKYDYYYTQYDEGCFIIGSSLDTSSNLILYIIPDSNSTPELVCSEYNQLIQLYELVSNNLRKQLNQMKTNKFIDSYINNAHPNDLNENSFDNTSENIS